MTENLQVKYVAASEGIEPPAPSLGLTVARGKVPLAHGMSLSLQRGEGSCALDSAQTLGRIHKVSDQRLLSLVSCGNLIRITLAGLDLSTSTRNRPFGLKAR